MNIKQKILSRGYRLVIIRPDVFRRDLLPNISELYSILQKNVVSMRGWNFPHLDTKKPYITGTDWVGENFQWGHHLSSWRFYQSGLFIHLSGMEVDWRDESDFWPADKEWKPNQLLGIGDTIYRNTEIIELAARLSMTASEINNFIIKIEVGNISGRKLYMDDRSRFWGFHYDYESQIDKYPYEKEFTKSNLISNTRDIAVKISVEQFKRFGWHVEFDQIKSLQDRFVKQ